MADKKLIATIVSSREKGIRRREEGETTSSQRKISTQGNQDECKMNHTKPEDESPTQRRYRKHDIDDEARRIDDMKQRRRTIQALHCRWRCSVVSEKKTGRQQGNQQQRKRKV